MHGNDKTWQEQLAAARGNLTVAGGTDVTQGSSQGASEEGMESAIPESVVPPAAKPALPPRSPGPADTMDVSNGKLTLKSPSGDVSIPLSKEAEAEFVKKALQYQQALIAEKRANMFATYAMAALSGFSALAIGATLIRSSLSKSSPSILGS